MEKTNEKHGKRRTREYTIWCNMKARCCNENNQHYHLYGGKGIAVCTKWTESFSTFLSDMGEAPSGYTLDRKDSEGGYSKDNCRWATRTTQCQNRGLPKNNLTGHLGVSLRKGKHPTYLAKIADQSGGILTKSFSLRKYGENEALELALQWRINKVEWLNTLGANYNT